MKIAIMQPYFAPYVGYFRLFCAVDLFVIYDCVQFPRRSWVHRNKLYNDVHQLDWLTLPLQKQSMDVFIKDLKFQENTNAEWEIRLNRFSNLAILKNKYPKLMTTLLQLEKYSPLEYIVNCLQAICDILDINFNITYSSKLNLPKEIKGQDRILSIAKYFQATDYINSPGGRALYDENEFLNQGIKLHFLPDYQGDHHSILQCLIDHDANELKNRLPTNEFERLK